jgi:hypothetical protein
MSVFLSKSRRLSIAATTFLLLIAASAVLLRRDAHAGGQLECLLSLGVLCSGTSNLTSSLVGVAKNWCGTDSTGGPTGATTNNRECTPNDPDRDYLVLSTSRTIFTPAFERLGTGGTRRALVGQAWPRPACEALALPQSINGQFATIGDAASCRSWPVCASSRRRSSSGRLRSPAARIRKCGDGGGRSLSWVR